MTEKTANEQVPDRKIPTILARPPGKSFVNSISMQEKSVKL